jgi:hypothetical protein
VAAFDPLLVALGMIASDFKKKSPGGWICFF